MKAGRHEILQVSEAVAREKGLNKEDVLEALELAIQRVAKMRYGQDNDVRTSIDRQTGQIHLTRFRQIVEEVTNTHTEMSTQEAREKNLNLVVGDFFQESLPPLYLGRVGAQYAKQLIFQRVQDLERAHQYEELKDRVGDLINGIVKRVEFGNVTIELGKAEGLLRRDELLPREIFRPGDRVIAYVQDVRRTLRGPQIFLSRRDNQFMAKLFAQEVPEIYDGIIEVKSVARDPGSRAKIAVYSRDPSIDPVGSCVGVRGSRVQAVVQELQGEKVDIIPWSSDVATFVVNALAPAEVTKIVLGREEKRLEVIVPDDQLSLAIGRKGQNVRLASDLTGMSIDLSTESEDSQKRITEMSTLSKSFMEALDVDEVIAHLLVAEGFESVEEISTFSEEEWLNFEGFTPEIAQELRSRSLKFLEAADESRLAEYKALGGTTELANLGGLSPELLLELAINKITTLDEIAELSGDELQDMLQNKISIEQANEIIMAARAHWFSA